MKKKIVRIVEGDTDLEDYVARVTTGEDGAGPPAALRAQAIAARTFVLRAMREDPNLGTYKHPIPNSPRFQVYAHTASVRAALAASETAGIVCRHQGELILCNYVAGALWTGESEPGQDPTHTEKWVTYNDGKTGSLVKPSPLSNTSRPDNRGCMSQNGANWLAAHGREYPAILRFFYGADLEIGPLDGPAPMPNPIDPTRPQVPEPEPARAASNSSPLPIVAALALAFLGDPTP